MLDSSRLVVVADIVPVTSLVLARSVDASVVCEDGHDVELLWLAVRMIVCDGLVEATPSNNAVVTDPSGVRAELEADVNSCAKLEADVDSCAELEADVDSCATRVVIVISASAEATELPSACVNT